MRLKEIENGTIVHCETKEDAKKLVELTGSDNAFEEHWENNFEGIAYRIEDGKIDGYSDLGWYEDGCYEIVKFSDIIEDELTAEEALKIYAKVCERGCEDCPIRNHYNENDCEYYMRNNAKEVVELLKEWKAQQEKKEPKVEWVYRVYNMETGKDEFLKTEAEAIARCEELVKTQKSQGYAQCIKVCRQKGE